MHVVAGLLLPCLTAAAPLKVFLMVGQSNMQGHGYYKKKDGSGRPVNGTIDWLADDPRTAKEFSKLKDGQSYSKRKDVWITYNKQKASDTSITINMHGELVGYGGDPGEDHMGPELGFGWTVGDALEQQVLLLKVAWGGKNLAVDYRPPSSGGKTGHYYTTLMKDIKYSLANLKQYFPAYSGSYELAGLAWHQGWNDGMSGDDYDKEYEANLVNFIKDLRKELGVAKLPVSIGVSGMLGWHGAKNPKRDIICDHQFAVADPKRHPEFKGNVATVETRDFHRDPSFSPGPQAFHWSNNAESYWLVGKAMAQAMLSMLGPSPPTPTPAPTPPTPPTPGPAPPPGSCIFTEGVGMDAYLERIVASSQEACCGLCAARPDCTQAVYQHGKCKFGDASATEVEVADAVLCQISTTVI